MAKDLENLTEQERSRVLQMANNLYNAFWDKSLSTEQAVLVAATKNIDKDHPIDRAWRNVAREALVQIRLAEEDVLATIDMDLKQVRTLIADLAELERALSVREPILP
jgi:hypothetical protein